MQIFSPLVGVGFRGSLAVHAVKSLTPDDGNKLSLEAEPNNEFDDHAVKVIYNNELHIGYISRDSNKMIFRALQDGRDLTISIVGFDTPTKPVLLIEGEEPA